MKKLLPVPASAALFVLLFVISFQTSAQNVFIPDSSFRNKLILLGYGACITGDSIDSSCPGVSTDTSLNVSSSNIYDLQGIQAFKNLRNLNCWRDSLSTLPDLPDSLTVLLCGNNRISSLPSLPANLTSLQCASNKLSSLPLLPNTLSVLDCRFNLLTSLPAIPDSMVSLLCDYNPNIKCLPKIGYLRLLSFKNTGITCVPIYDLVIQSFPFLSSLPYCETINQNNCSGDWNIQGRIFHDTNNNCIYDSGEITETNVMLELLQNGNKIAEAFSDVEGIYAFKTGLGEFEIRLDTTKIPFSISCLAGNHYLDTLTAADSIVFNRDFPLTCRPGFDLSVRSIVHADQLGNSAHVTMKVIAGDLSQLNGNVCSSNIPAVLKVWFNGPVSYYNSFSPSLTPALSGDTLIWNVADITSIDPLNAFTFTVLTNNSTTGTAICFNASISTSLGTEINVVNNDLQQCFKTGYFGVDDNLKESFPHEMININEDRWITYTVNFRYHESGPLEEMAENVKVSDKLSPFLDPSTFELLSSSHPLLMHFNLDQTLEFNFPGLHFFSHFSSPNHGFVQFKIQVRDTVSPGTVIQNQATTWFDNTTFGTNVSTITVSTTAGIDLPGEAGSEFSIFPNPFNDQFDIVMRSDKIPDGELIVFDVMGSIVLKQKISQTHLVIPALQWSPGVYFVRFQDSKGQSVHRILKN